VLYTAQYVSRLCFSKLLAFMHVILYVKPHSHLILAVSTGHTSRVYAQCSPLIVTLLLLNIILTIAALRLFLIILVLIVLFIVMTILIFFQSS
jgi:hypothetical protein